MQGYNNKKAAGYGFLRIDKKACHRYPHPPEKATHGFSRSDKRLAIDFQRYKKRESRDS
jgi:hypothetical protein